MAPSHQKNVRTALQERHRLGRHFGNGKGRCWRACHIIHVITPESNRVFTVGMELAGTEGRGELLICSYPFAFQELHNRRALSFQCFERRKSFIEYLFR